MPWTSAKWASAPWRSTCSASTHRMSTRASLAIPPWAIASTRLLYESFRSMYLPTTAIRVSARGETRSEEHTSELQSHSDLVCRLLLEKKKRTELSIESITKLAARAQARADRQG